MGYTGKYDLGRGDWRFDPFRRIRVWVPMKVPDGAVCTDCGAMPDQSCTTRNDHRTKDHAVRVAPRSCRCGAKLTWKARVCTTCAIPSYVPTGNPPGRPRRVTTTGEDTETAA